MLRRRARLLLVVATLAGVAGAAAGGARAAAPPVYYDCAAVAPHATLTLGPGVRSVEATRHQALFSDGFCKRFVVDVHVPSDSSGGPGYHDRFVLEGLYAGPGHGGMGVPFSQAGCALYSDHLSLYRKGGRVSEFAPIGGGTRYGSWHPGGPDTFALGCLPTKTSGYDEPPTLTPPSFGTVVYRVTFAAKLDDHFQTVRVRAAHPPIIY